MVTWFAGCRGPKSASSPFASGRWSPGVGVDPVLLRGWDYTSGWCFWVPLYFQTLFCAFLFFLGWDEHPNIYRLFWCSGCKGDTQARLLHIDVAHGKLTRPNSSVGHCFFLPVWTVEPLQKGCPKMANLIQLMRDLIKTNDHQCPRCRTPRVEPPNITWFRQLVA